MDASVSCRRCLDSSHVCEDHPLQPWAGIICNCEFGAFQYPHMCTHSACACGAARMPCQDCCSPVPEDGSHSIVFAFTPDRLRSR